MWKLKQREGCVQTDKSTSDGAGGLDKKELEQHWS